MTQPQQPMTQPQEPPEALAKAYVPAEFEHDIYARWLAADVFAPDGAGSTADWSLEPFVLIQPPPNVTGSLHLGHAQRTTVEDLMVRHARMLGRPALFLPGLDHAGIAAQFVLDGILAQEGESRTTLGRERYLERMRGFIEDTRTVILGQQRRVGGSCDWGRLRFTMDEVSSRAVREAFLRLYRKDLAYRAEALVNWCPGCRTSVSDLEVIPTPETGSIWRVRYHLLDEATGLPDPQRPSPWRPPVPRRSWATPRSRCTRTIPATQPWSVAGCGSRSWSGTCRSSLTRWWTPRSRRVPSRSRRRTTTTTTRRAAATVSLMPTILDDSAHVADTGTAYDGLDRHVARARIVEDLAAQGDLEGVQPHEMVIGRCQRSADVVEPRLKTQWFIRTGPLAEAALAATRSGATRILPERFEKTWEHWLVNIRDWNVSRQLWWGHRIPVWYCPDGHPTVSAEPSGPDACEACARPASTLTQDPDVFDTWFSSGLWPFSTLGWPAGTDDLARFYPGAVMETAYDIIFFWIARMMMLGIELMGEVPFRVVYLSGLIRDPYGQKMSKTKGNTVDPLGTIDVVGADALRFAVVHGATPGNDQRFGPAKVENARNFGNKLWNATRYVLGARPVTIPGDAPRQAPDPALLGPAERWILSRAADTVGAVDRAMADFGFGEVTRLLHEAIWSEYCDWGIELAKTRLADEGLPAVEREATWWALVDALDTYLRLLHPVMPFITERLWAALPHAADDPALLIVARWPAAGERDEAAETQVGALVDLVRAVRNARADAKLEPAAWLPLDVFVEPELGEALEALRPALERMGRARPLRRHASRGALHEAAGATGGLAVIAGPAEAIVGTGEADPGAVEADRARLDRELADAERLLEAARARLANEAFTAKAPPAIVEGARSREAELADQVERLRGRLSR